MPETGPSRRSSTTAEIEDLVPRTELLDIRLRRIDGEIVRAPADEMKVAMSNKEPMFSRSGEKILVLFQDRLDYSLGDSTSDEEGEHVGHVEVSHIVEVKLLGEGEPSDESISHFVRSNVVFMVFPYIRAALNRVPTEFGLAPITLPYLHRPIPPASGTDEDEA